MSLAYKSVLKMHCLITLPWISVNFLFKAEFWPESRAKFFFYVYAKTSFQTPWARAACKLPGKNIASLELPIEAVVLPNVQIWQTSCFPCSRNLHDVLLLSKSNKQYVSSYSALKPGAFVEIWTKDTQYFPFWWWLFLYFLKRYKFGILRTTSRHKVTLLIKKKRER